MRNDQAGASRASSGRVAGGGCAAVAAAAGVEAGCGGAGETFAVWVSPSWGACCGSGSAGRG